ncbi:hypothetical protein GCM10010384_31900 [Streptomyces djakartensis]|uniref:Uncharacterized protein n=1 Tax=Streptomyces djakartensis TaxID=68193 RepID=A0ABQ2ZTM8_9ACTN|nr:hypothetical protein GCM10010384_31900 [Streptomyces djakartensis]
MTYFEQPVPAPERRASPLLTLPAPVTPHHTPVPLHAHPTARAIRVLRSPR